MSLPVQEGQQQHQEGPTLQPFHNDFLRIYEDCRAARQNQYWSSLNGNLSGLPSFPAVGETAYIFMAVLLCTAATAAIYGVTAHDQ